MEKKDIVYVVSPSMGASLLGCSAVNMVICAQITSEKIALPVPLRTSVDGSVRDA